MKLIAILLPRGNVNFVKALAAKEIFDTANYHYQRQGHAPLFEIRFIGFPTSQVDVSGTLQATPHCEMMAICEPDLIIIPAMNDAADAMLAGNNEMIAWIRTSYERGAAVAGLCTGVFLLAATGLLKGRECTTHWWAAASLQQMFPEVRVVPEKIMTARHRLYTSAGSYSSFHLVLHLVALYYGQECATQCAKYLQIDPDRNSQLPFSIFSGSQNHDDQAVLAAQHYIVDRITERITIEQLAALVFISKRNFIRRFTRATGLAPGDYIRKSKIEYVKKALEQGRKTVSEIMYEIGYNDEKAFRQFFRKLVGVTPNEYKRKFSTCHYHTTRRLISGHY